MREVQVVVPADNNVDAHEITGKVGPDVLVLQEKRGKLLWRNIEFSPRALAGPQFAAYRRLPGGFAVFVRKG